jgi:hypothetical protein
MTPETIARINRAVEAALDLLRVPITPEPDPEQRPDPEQADDDQDHRPDR